MNDNLISTALVIALAVALNCIPGNKFTKGNTFFIGLVILIFGAGLMQWRRLWWSKYTWAARLHIRIRADRLGVVLVALGALILLAGLAISLRTASVHLKI
jgi:formate hydrogenlyase subunit 3/multisubunit Na+/H+ antiporter MnhD subunit